MRIHERVGALERHVTQQVTVICIRHNADGRMSATRDGQTAVSDPGELEAVFKVRMAEAARRDTEGHILVLVGSEIDG